MKRNLYKLIVASMGISVILATSNVYAQSDEGQYLQEWYKSRSHQLKTEMIDSTVVQGLLTASQSLKVSLSGSANLAANNLQETLDAGSREAIMSIESTNEAYIGQMKKTAAEIVEITKEQQFDTFIRTTTSQNSDELEKLAEDTIKELTKQLDGVAAPVSSN